MKRFLVKLGLVSLVTLLGILSIFSTANGYTDPFYIRFTTPKHRSMIIGTSRAAQGLQPIVFENVLGKQIDNYAFTVDHSPYGKVYLESIKKKHSRESEGYFVLAVDPWSISSWNNTPDDSTKFRENKHVLNSWIPVDIKPNIFYLYKVFSGKYLDILRKRSSYMYLHENGWLEISGIKMDSTTVKLRIDDKIKTYRNSHLPRVNFSAKRLGYLIQTIDYLNDYGPVYLVRLPVHPEMMEIEKELIPEFDSVIKKAIAASDGYLDLTPQNANFEYTDGNHLYKDSGAQVSEQLANWIKELQGENR